MSDHKFQNDNTDVDLKFKLEAIKEEPSIHEVQLKHSNK